MDDRKRKIWRLTAVSCGLLLAAGAVVGLHTDGTKTDSTLGVSSTTVPSQASVAQAGQTGQADSKALSGGTGSAQSNMSAASDLPAPASEAPAPGATTSGPAPSALPAMGQQKIVKNATISVEVKKGGFRDAFDAAATAASGHGGYVVSSDSNVQKGQTSTGTIVIRVPADAFDAVRADLVKLGSVKDEHLSGEDVSGRLVDLDARIRSLQAQEDAIRTLMSRARTVGETMEIQNQLTAVRQQIEQLGGEKARLDNAASLSTITLRLAEPGAALEPPKPVAKHAPSPVRHSLTLAAHGAEIVVAGTIVVLGWVIPLGLLALVGWGLWRLGRRVHPATF
jgi:hypothetical protein